MKSSEIIPFNLTYEQSSASSDTLTIETHHDASRVKNEAIWSKLATLSVADALTSWFSTLNTLTAKNYKSGMQLLIDKNIINPRITLQLFSLVNHNAIIDSIKNIADLTEASKQARAACYISFTRFLNRRTDGIIQKATPSREGVTKTFYRVREKVHTEAMTQCQWTEFLRKLRDYNERDALIAKVVLQGGKRLCEVLSLTTDMINYTQREISFKQSKTKGYEKETVITYPQSVMDELSAYIGPRTGLVFVTRTGKRILHHQLSNTFARAGEDARIPFKVTPHVLRASTVTFLKREGFADSDIMKVTGHASAHMVHAYDKSERAQNATKKISLV